MLTQDEEWVEVGRDQISLLGPDDVGRKLKLEAAAYGHDMYGVVKTDLVYICGARIRVAHDYHFHCHFLDASLFYFVLGTAFKTFCEKSWMLLQKSCACKKYNPTIMKVICMPP
jgi:hypothetical protein